MKLFLTFLSGAVVGYFVGKRQPTKAAPYNNPPKPPPLLRGIKGDGGKGGLIDRQAREKEAHKASILELLKTTTPLTNTHIEQMLGVSDATATRYLEELEKEGKVRQVGKTGRGVVYEKVESRK
ncbi:MAG: FaeA/PapI family transcriptional regulator [Patescibacteria group bacterium]